MDTLVLNKLADYFECFDQIDTSFTFYVFIKKIFLVFQYKMAYLRSTYIFFLANLEALISSQNMKSNEILLFELEIFDLFNYQSLNKPPEANLLNLLKEKSKHPSNTFLSVREKK